jgi:predicted AAA+ superfamily ATPase
MMLLDTGIFQRILGLDFTVLYSQPDFPMVNKGLLAEQFWGLEYIKYQSPEAYPDLYYWQREGKSNAEVDFLAQKNGAIYPIEIKSSGKGQMQSLRVFLSEKKQTHGYRFSMENFAEYQDIKVLPLYAVSNFCMNL